MERDTGRVMRLDWLADPNIDRRLLPGMLRKRDNSRRLRHQKNAIRWAMGLLKPEQQEQLRLYYAGGLSKGEIAERQKVSSSWMSKQIRDGEKRLRMYANLYMEIYDQLEQEFLQDE